MELIVEITMVTIKIVDLRQDWGNTHIGAIPVICEPLGFISRLAALVFIPRVNLDVIPQRIYVKQQSGSLVNTVGES